MAEGFVPPQPVRDAAQRGLDLRREHGRGGTAVGIARARDLARGANISYDTIKRMNSFFARHEVDKKGKDWDNTERPSNGKIAWLLWGGDPGWAWAKRVIREQESKEKASMTDVTTTYAAIIKADKNDDGTLTVYGKATDDSLDIDQQICDAAWLDAAMPQWFKSGGNIREQHSNIAAGVAKEYEAKQDGHYITALVVDPVSVKKVETGVLKGFSIGIKNPRVVRDQKAANGRIIDGQIVEVSLVDRPANPNAKLTLAKSLDGETDLVQVEELVEKADEKPDYEGIMSGEGGTPTDKDLYARVVREAKEKFDVYPSAVANAWVVREYKKRGGTYRKKDKAADDKITEITEGWQMEKSDAIVDKAKALAATLEKQDHTRDYEAARRALATLISAEAAELAEGDDERHSLRALLFAVESLLDWAHHEAEEGELPGVMLEDEGAEVEAEIELSADADEEKAGHKADDEEEMTPEDGESEDDFMKRCKEAGKSDDYAKACWDKYMKGAHGKKDKSTEAVKCLECGCHQPAEDHGREDVTTAEMIQPKSAETKTSDVDPSEIAAIVERAVKSATESIRAEVADVLSAKEAAEQKAAGLEDKLADALTKAAAGGPSRTVKPVNLETSDMLTKAAAYRAKARAATDPQLAKGYEALAAEYETKAAN